MKRIIDEIHNESSRMFRLYLQMQVDLDEPLCHLEAAGFKCGFPNYEDEAHASLYLMRYAAAYLAEYFLAYSRLFKAGFLPLQKVTVLSLGAGTDLDGVAAQRALEGIHRPAQFTYLGVDRAEWPITFSYNSSYLHIRKDIENLTVSDVGSYEKINVISLPKLLSEVEADTIADFVTRLAYHTLESRFALIISNRTARRQNDRTEDDQKIEDILDHIEMNTDYRIDAESHLLASDLRYEGKRIKDLPDLPGYPDFFPPEIISMADDPGQYCCQKDRCPKRSSYSNGNGRVTSDCRQLIGRFPITRTSYFDTHLYLLENT